MTERGPESPLPASAAVRVDGVDQRFQTSSGPVDALSGANLDIGHGEFISLIGPSGSGKSTLLNIIAGLLAPTGGAVEVNGKRVTGPPPEIGMMFQSPVLLEWRTARANVLLPLEAVGGRALARQKVERANDLLALTGLAGFENKYPRELSGGMQQRVAVCRMLIADPEVLLLDEPFGALDELTREHMNVELSKIVEESARAAVLVTHSIQEAVFMADRVYAMSARPGRISGIVDVDIPRPRSLDLLTSEHFQHLCREVRTYLDGAHDVAPSGEGSAR